MKGLSQDFWDSGEERIHFRLWEDELIFDELEHGLLPWVFVTEQVTIDN